MKTKIRFRKTGFVFGLVVIFSLLTSAIVYAKTGDPIVELFRLGGTQVGIKITFPDGVSGNFLGMIGGNAFDCTTIPPDVVYCIGPFQKGADSSTLFLIDQDTKETVLKQVVISPRPKNKGGPKPETCVKPPLQGTSFATTEPCPPIDQ